MGSMLSFYQYKIINQDRYSTLDLYSQGEDSKPGIVVGITLHNTSKYYQYILVQQQQQQQWCGPTPGP